MQSGGHFTLFVNFLSLIKIEALHFLWLSFKFWIIAICLWDILIKNLLTWPYLFSFLWVITFTLSFLTYFRCQSHRRLVVSQRGFTLFLHWRYVFSHWRYRSLYWACPLFLFLMRLMKVLLTYSAVCSQKVYSFVQKMAIFFIWSRFKWRYPTIARWGINTWVDFGFLSIGLTS